MASMKKCAICHEDPCNSISLIKVGERGSKWRLKANRERGDNLEIQAGQHVHKKCRRVYTNPHEIQKAQREKKNAQQKLQNCDLNHSYLIFELIVSSVAKL